MGSRESGQRVGAALPPALNTGSLPAWVPAGLPHAPRSLQTGRDGLGLTSQSLLIHPGVSQFSSPAWAQSSTVRPYLHAGPRAPFPPCVPFLPGLARLLLSAVASSSLVLSRCSRSVGPRYPRASRASDRGSPWCL